MALFQHFQPPASSRYVLLYSVQSVPTGFFLVPDSMTRTVYPDQSWTEYENPCDPHLSHILHMDCPFCNEPTRELTVMASNSRADDEDTTKKNHLLARCSRNCPNNTKTKIRILRRACVPIIPDQPSAMLEVEVIGPLRIRENAYVGKHEFELFAVNAENQFKTAHHAETPDGRCDLTVEGDNGYVRGFGGHWVQARWEDQSYDAYGLSGIDHHCAKLEDWPPLEWFYNDEEDEVNQEGVEEDTGDDLKILGVEGNGHEVNQVNQEGVEGNGHEVNQGAEGNGHEVNLQGIEGNGDEVNQVVADEANLVQEGNGGEVEGYEFYEASDAESAA